MRHREKGFSLIELMIVVGIILVLVAIAVPNILAARRAANEACAVSAMRLINTSAANYWTSYGNGFPPTLAAMGTAAAGDTVPTCDEALMMDEVLTTGTKSGYTFAYTVGTVNAIPVQGCANPGGGTYTLVATPQQVGGTGQRMFYTDQTGVIRYDVSGAGAGPNSQPME
ncbi:MAG: type II secretion system protein [Candidatus Acidiferrales bacterium]